MFFLTTPLRVFFVGCLVSSMRSWWFLLICKISNLGNYISLPSFNINSFGLAFPFRAVYTPCFGYG